jgi:murein DD-endopeptidase MepM/ murein hydrolase activator NlpD
MTDVSIRRVPLRSLLLAALTLAACDRVPFAARAAPASARERYARALEDARLDGTALGRDWIAAGTRALGTPVDVAMPLRERGFFGTSEALAVGYRFTVPTGRRLRIRIAAEADSATHLFAELFELPADGSPEPPRLAASSDSLHATLDAEADRASRWVLRLQPELLRAVHYTIEIEGVASLGFPVEGRDSRAVRSFWGAVRDGGARDHQGIDIFAPRGTPAIAATDGVAYPSENGLGGHVVFLYDPRRGRSLYYAHLDRQLVGHGALVKAGDTLGLVGNTGNARTTAPHLHFGIYRRGEGAIDPLPFVDTRRSAPAPLGRDSALVGRVLRTASASTLRGGPATRFAGLWTVPARTTVIVDGAASGGWTRVRFPDGRGGYLPASAIEASDAPFGRQRLAAATTLRVRPDPGAPPIDVLEAPAEVGVLGRFGAFALVEVDGSRGWVETGGR